MFTKNILIIEADGTDAALFASAFSGTSYKIYFSRNYAEALKESARLKPLLIIIDAATIEGNEEGILRKLRQACVSHNPIVLASFPQGNKTLRDRVHSWGVEGYITKPFDPRGLSLRIEKLLPDL